jgi:hypothetical protein
LLAVTGRWMSLDSAISIEMVSTGGLQACRCQESDPLSSGSSPQSVFFRHEEAR